ncbi:helix-turn-helix domain-containing protein [Candidatus Nomurabacteria bacterium]|nr:helix-turn-helix domain-containing protein [Candidatus Nomurabacteria bacterium]
MQNQENTEQNKGNIELLTLQEACDMLKVHPNTLRQWDKNGTLPAIRIGTKRIRRYKKQDIINFLESNS